MKILELHKKLQTLITDIKFDVTEPVWLQDLRKRGVEQFLQNPVEEKYSRKLVDLDCAIAEFNTKKSSVKEVLDNLAVDQINSCLKLDCYSLVFVDGVYIESLSQTAKLDERVRVMDVIDAISEEEEALEKNLLHKLNFDFDSFAALNNALFNYGAFISVPDEVVVDKPLQVLFVTTGKGSNNLFVARNVIIVGKNSKVAIWEHHLALDDMPYLNNSVTELDIAANANVDYVKLHNQNQQALHIGSLGLRAAANSQINAYDFLLGKEKNYTRSCLDLEGDAVKCHLSGLYMLNEDAYNLRDIVINHSGEESLSRVLYKGVLYDKARSDIYGKIIAQSSAKGSDADLKNYNLLLGDSAQAIMQPELEVYVDDVKCSHGATCGELDENALFYLKSRGIGKEAAYKLLLDAFMQEVLQKLNISVIKEYTDNLIGEKYGSSF